MASGIQELLRYAGTSHRCPVRWNARVAVTRQWITVGLDCTRASVASGIACTGVTHKARAALFGLSGRRHGRAAGAAFADPASSGRRSGLSDLPDPIVKA